MHELITSELLKIFTISAKFCCNKQVKLFAVLKKITWVDKENFY